MKPALTPEEWSSRRAHRPWGVLFNALDDASFSALGPDGKHVAAALCLDGQRYGFTWEDVDLLRNGLIYEQHEYMPHTIPFFNDLANRIAALLPPREP